MQYRDVELELWELDRDDSGYSRKNGGNRTGRSHTDGKSRIHTDDANRNRTPSDRKQVNSRNIRLYEQRPKNDSGSRSNQDSGSQYRTDRSRSSQNESKQGRRTQTRTTSQTANKRPARELQVQDIRRYQGDRATAYGNVQSVYVGNARPVQSIKRRKKRRRKVYLARALAVMFVVLCLVMIYYLTGEIYRAVHNHTDKSIIQTASQKFDEATKDNSGGIAPPAIIEDYLDVNDYSRPGTPLGKINSIFVHYTANPGTSAAQNRSYFANLALTQERSASAHLIIGYEGEVVQCIPFDEQAYAVMTRNEDSISIECCYTSDDGSFTQETYDTLVHTLAWLVDQYNLSTDDILRHYDCGGKLCPVYYVEHEDAWNQLLRDVDAYIDAGVEQPEQL
ncbi:MAG: N-acetylmuramoyl-L-alanine amidase [Eubacterium sp.]|nr:N-acetylmuramoyl-L-alanine amidase [Eubacterium sp.]